MINYLPWTHLPAIRRWEILFEHTLAATKSNLRAFLHLSPPLFHKHLAYCSIGVLLFQGCIEIILNWMLSFNSLSESIRSSSSNSKPFNQLSSESIFFSTLWSLHHTHALIFNLKALELFLKNVTNQVSDFGLLLPPPLEKWRCRKNWGRPKQSGPDKQHFNIN